MKMHRVNMNVTFSAALAGFLMGVTSPSAFGHGNNPSFSDTAPNTPEVPDDPNHRQSSSNERDVLTRDPDVRVFIVVDLLDALDIRSQVLGDRLTGRQRIRLILR